MSRISDVVVEHSDFAMLIEHKATATAETFIARAFALIGSMTAMARSIATVR
jgi:hypothetical protein